MGKALYRTYRSKSLDEIVGQEHITDTLKNAIKSGRISHAYLLTGPRGVGKTSVARILAHQINDIPYTDDSAHLDIIEIDAASNRRIDEIRELRDKVYIAPTSAKYKVYIIDEVHMLTKEAFNALLKTLEEPPEHVVFILATTDAHKVPETIISRTQRFTFKPVVRQAVIDHLATIAKTENITITPEALALIADHGQGSFRDSISLLDQARGINAVLDEQAVAHMIGVPETTLVESLLASVQHHDTLQTIQTLQDLTNQGYQSASIASSLSKLLRTTVLNGENTTSDDITFMQDLLQVPTAFQPDQYLEIILIKATQGGQATKITPITQQVPLAKAETLVSTPKIEEPTPKAAKKTDKLSAPITSESAVPEKSNDKPQSKESPLQELDEQSWSQILSALKAQYNTLYGVIRMARPRFDNDELVLVFAFAFHQKRVSETKNQHVLATIVQDVLGKSVKISCIVEKDVTPPKVTVPATTPPVAVDSANISSISNIFGGAELLES